MINNNNDTNNNNNKDRQNPSGGNIEHGVPEDPATLRHSASSTESTSSSTSSRPMSSADHVRALARSQEEEAVPHPDEGLILDSDRVAAAHMDGGISQSSQVMTSLTGIIQGPGQTLVSTYVADPQSIAAGNAYHLTVPPRYVELGDMRKAMNLDGTFGKGAVGDKALHPLTSRLCLIRLQTHPLSTGK